MSDLQESDTTGTRCIPGPTWNQHGDGESDRYVATISVPADKLLIDVYVRSESGDSDRYGNFFVLRYHGQQASDCFIVTIEQILSFLVFSYPSLLSSNDADQKDHFRASVYRCALRLMLNTGGFASVSKTVCSAR